MENVTSLMVRHHAAIDLMLKLFMDETDKSSASAKKIFEDFKWELEKHIFTEDRVIFKLCADSEQCKLAEELSVEHKRMFDLLDKIEKDLNSSEASAFQYLLVGHRKREEEKLYPKLDEVLTERQKQLTFERVNEISPLP
jgi:hypothetical protein